MHLTEIKAQTKPRVAFVGLGWIGRHRMEGILDLVEPAAIFEPFDQARDDARALVPGAEVVDRFEDALDLRPDAVVIATPSALHAEQTIRALEAGCAVFCQKPLGRTAAEVREVVDTARRMDRLLRVDLSYRGTAALNAIRNTIREGRIGKVFAVDLVFHNAYGPDKPWFYDKRLSGGGALMDLGVHLVDSALWCLEGQGVQTVCADLFRGGVPLTFEDEVEDYATAMLRTADGTNMRLACSWGLNAGRDAVIGAHFYGTEGGVSLTNPGGDFYDFEAWLHEGTSTRCIAHPEPWGTTMIRSWAEELGHGGGFDESAEDYVRLSEVVDDIYAKGMRR